MIGETARTYVVLGEPDRVTQRGVSWNHLRTDLAKIQELIDAIENEGKVDDSGTPS